MKPKIETIYVDYMRLVPIMTHFIDRKTLNNRFNFLVEPRLFGSEYLGPPRKFIHHLGALRPLSPTKWKYPFWRNLFGGTSLDKYIKCYLGEYFGYLPYFIKVGWKIDIVPNSRLNKEITLILSRAKIALTARLFPMGATAIHLMVFFNSEKAEIEHFVEIQEMILRESLFRVTDSRSI